MIAGLDVLPTPTWLPFNSCVPADFSIMASSSLEESSFREHRHHPQNPWVSHLAGLDFLMRPSCFFGANPGLICRLLNMNLEHHLRTSSSATSWISIHFESFILDCYCYKLGLRREPPKGSPIRLKISRTWFPILLTKTTNHLLYEMIQEIPKSWSWKHWVIIPSAMSHGKWSSHLQYEQNKSYTSVTSIIW